MSVLDQDHVSACAYYYMFCGRGTEEVVRWWHAGVRVRVFFCQFSCWDWDASRTRVINSFIY